ncbi:MAG: hypothetical protein NZ528_00420 [Caldilineales bacterium]|nr:hypothetical protein [Caldilineales bacterium]
MTAQLPNDLETIRQRENRLLLRVTAALGCVLLLCLLAAAITVGLALIWSLQGTLGPGGAF